MSHDDNLTWIFDNTSEEFKREAISMLAGALHGRYLDSLFTVSLAMEIAYSTPGDNARVIKQCMDLASGLSEGGSE